MQSISCKVVRALFKFNSNYIIKLNRAHLGGLSFFKFQACNFIKNETLAQMFSCEFCEISKNIFLYRTPLVAAFVASLRENSNRELP